MSRLEQGHQAGEGVLKGDESGEVPQAAVQEGRFANKAVKPWREARRRNGEEGVSPGSIVQSKADKSKYTEKAWQALQSQIAAAQKVYDDKDAKQADVDAAQDALDKAFWATKPSRSPAPSSPAWPTASRTTTRAA